MCKRLTVFKKVKGSRIQQERERENGREVGRCHLIQTVNRHLNFILNAMREATEEFYTGCMLYQIYIFKRLVWGDFPGGLLAQTLSSQCRKLVFDP